LEKQELWLRQNHQIPASKVSEADDNNILSQLIESEIEKKSVEEKTFTILNTIKMSYILIIYLNTSFLISILSHFHHNNSLKKYIFSSLTSKIIKDFNK
jgi:glutamine phosphoribosylpyrophosphate amidotransferase